MGLFDFLKPKSKDIFDDPSITPSMRKLMLAMDLEYTKKEIANLKEVGRSEDAFKHGIAFLQRCMKESERDPDGPDSMRFFADAAMKLGLLEAGEMGLITMIEAYKPYSVIDLTLMFTDLGRIYHQMGDRPEKELAAYTLATSCNPKYCKRPASSSDKAKAHNFAHFCAFRLNQQEQALYHDEMRRKLVPELDWDDRAAVMEWLQG